jgi:hypothetical protein
VVGRGDHEPRGTRAMGEPLVDRDERDERVAEEIRREMPSVEAIQRASDVADDILDRTARGTDQVADNRASFDRIGPPALRAARRICTLPMASGCSQWLVGSPAAIGTGRGDRRRPLGLVSVISTVSPALTNAR